VVRALTCKRGLPPCCLSPVAEGAWVGGSHTAGAVIGRESANFATACLRPYTEPCKLQGMDGGGADSARSRSEPRGGGGPQWEAAGVRALRRHLGLTQGRMAEELGTRQQTVSEWETGLYRPRGTSARLLTIVAERAGFQYGKARPRPEGDRAERTRDSRS
jgi:DNA-binding XRE family transcriptional regulator